MAHQYIDVNNQTMLWKLIQRSPQFVNNTVKINREQWFGNVIKHFYEQITVSKFSIEELKILNQKTITYMLSDLKRIEQSQRVAPASTLSYDDISSPDKPRTPYDNKLLLANPQPPINVIRPGMASLSTYNEQFNARQQEYTNMIKPPAHPIPNFGEKVDEDVITNMEELVEQQKKQREYDIVSIQGREPNAEMSQRLPSVKEEGAPPSTTHGAKSNDFVIQNLLSQIESMKKDIQFLMAERSAASSLHNKPQSIQENFCYQ